VIQKDVIVVGGGIAGLTAALSLAQKGKDVLLIEKNESCGGLTNSFVRDGFRFEAGARALVNAGLVKPLIKEFDLDIKVLPNPITLGIEERLLRIDGEQSLHSYAAVLKDLYPESKDEVDRIIQAIHEIIEDMKVLYGVDNPLFAKKRNVLSKAPSAVARTLKFVRTMYRIVRMDTPFEDYLDTLAENQSLKDIVGQHFFRRTPVFFALSYFALYGDYIYPKGGVGAFIQRLVEGIETRGGEIRCNAEIVRVDARNKMLQDLAGNRYRYNRMIWAADLKALYTMTSDDDVARESLGRFRTRKQAILAHKGAESVFSVFLAADLPPEFFRARASGHVFYTPNRRGLGTVHTTELQALLQRWDTVQKEDLYAWLEKFCHYNTFEISIPVLRDPDAAPPGKTGIIISTLFDYTLTSRIRARGWYEEFKKRVEELFIITVSSSIYPNLKDKVLFSFSASPWSICERVGSSEGSIVGWSFEGRVPVVTSMLNMGSSVKTALPDVYAAGKWVYSPAGGPTAIMTGRIAAKRCR
jgi:phytoene dehydrogenase-like protein